MSKKKVCKTCKIFVEGEECPICKGNQFSTLFQGRVYVVDVMKSDIGKKMGIEIKGEYAIKVR
jgi:RNA polymerase subunit RPABC4/transcription elongation factor Spt4